MRFRGSSKGARIGSGFLTALLAAALVVSGVLITGGQFADGAKKRQKDRKVLVWASHKPGQGATGQAKAGFMLHGAQTGPKSKRGARPLGIIAILIGLKADQRYVLRFSTARCGSSQGGGIYGAVKRRSLIGRGIKVVSSADGTAYVEQDSLWTRKANRRAKSVLLLEGDPDRPLIACGKVHVAAGDYNQDGIADGSD